MTETWKVAVFFAAVFVYIVGVAYLYWRTSDEYRLRKKRKELGYDVPSMFSSLKVFCLLCLGPINRKRWESKHKYYRTDDYGPPDSKWMEIRPPTDKNQEWQKLPRGDVERKREIISKAISELLIQVIDAEFDDAVEEAINRWRSGMRPEKWTQVARRVTVEFEEKDQKEIARQVQREEERTRQWKREEQAREAARKAEQATPYEMNMHYMEHRQERGPRRDRAVRVNVPIIDQEPRRDVQPRSGVSRSLSVNQLRAFVNSMQEDSLQDEYLAIPLNMTKPSAYPPEKRFLNRDARIVPNMKTRVKIDPPKGVGLRTDYINANLVRGYGKQRFRFIATQGPLSGHENDKANTQEHFWTMIWNYQVPVIVMMITPSAHRCPAYWPTSSQSEVVSFGPFAVRHVSRETVAGIVRTVLSLRCRGSQQEHIVTHLLLQHWPPTGVPAGTSGVITLLRKTRQIATGPGPIVVHDDVGLGPTGVFIAGYYLMDQVDKEQKVDIPKLVTELREDRGGLIQTLAEYQFIHKLAAVYSVTSTQQSRAPPSYAAAPK
eukprot:m.15384 g.15384  ORF g.15384 m.15384 type:complete len:547 (+) comp7843_c0_seq1:44-1684(+)